MKCLVADIKVFIGRERISTFLNESALNEIQLDKIT